MAWLAANSLLGLFCERCAPDEVEARIAMVMSGGTEGVLSPHASVFTRSSAEAGNGGTKRLAVGISHTRAFLPEDCQRLTIS